MAVFEQIGESGDCHAMIREKFCFQSVAGLGVVQVNADKASCNASFLYTVYWYTSSDQAKNTWSWSRTQSIYLQITQGTLFQQWQRPGSKRQHSLSTPADVCFPTGRLNQLSWFHRWVDLVLLFKKGVGREIAVLEVADNVFSNVQHARNPVPKLCGRRTAGDLSQSTFCVQNFFLEAPPLQPGSERDTAATLWFSMAKAMVVSRSFYATCSPVWLPRKTMSPNKRIKLSSPPQQSSHPW